MLFLTLQSTFVLDFSKIHDNKASRGMVRDPVILNHKPLLNGDFEFLGRQYRSSSEVSDVPYAELCLNAKSTFGWRWGKVKGALSRQFCIFLGHN